MYIIYTHKQKKPLSVIFFKKIVYERLLIKYSLYKSHSINKGTFFLPPNKSKVCIVWNWFIAKIIFSWGKSGLSQAKMDRSFYFGRLTIHNCLNPIPSKSAAKFCKYLSFFLFFLYIYIYIL